MTVFQHVIVGAGHAGTLAAVELRRTGFEGRIVLIGDERHLPYERPPLSKDVLLSNAEPACLHDRDKLDEAGVTTLLGKRATAIDTAAARVQLETGEAVAYDKLLLAPGGAARELPVPGGELAHTLRSLDDARQLKAGLAPGRRVAIVGAGVIGLEVAASAATIGCTVVVVEKLSGPMTRSAAPEIQAFINALHRRHGVELRYESGLEAIEREANGSLSLHLADRTRIEADILVAGIGLAPNVALARAAGLEVTTGIVVDEYGATSAANIFAAGDAVSFWHPLQGKHLHWQTWQHAQNHGKAVARAITGAATEPYAPLAWFWSDQHGINMQFTGETTGGEQTIFRGDPQSNRFTAFHLRAGIVVGATFVNNGALVRPAQALINARASVPLDALGDPALPLQKLARPS